MNLSIENALYEALKPELTSLNQDLESFAKSTDGFLGDLLSYVLVNSGKRVRPALVYLGAGVGQRDLASARVVEMAVELVHIATLVHDDVIDRAAMRRGQRTVSDLHGVETAVLLGDLIYTDAFRRLSTLKNPSLVEILAEATSRICEGEIEQLKMRYQFNVSEAEYFSFIEKKTAALFGAAAKAGGCLAGVPVPFQNALALFGHHLGLAFQITDDVLDLLGDESVVGKTLGTDLRYGKVTLPVLHCRDQKKAADRDAFLRLLKQPDGSLPQILAAIRETESVNYALGSVKTHVAKAKEAAALLPAGPSRDNLIRLAETLEHRES